jgi:hypothetical protein
MLLQVYAGGVFLWLMSIVEQKINHNCNKAGQNPNQKRCASMLKDLVRDELGLGSELENLKLVQACKKVVRGAILYVQLLCACFFLGQYFMWTPQSKTPQGGVLCTLFARSTISIFYKPLVPTMWYGLAHLLDNQGGMLHHTVFTDTLVGLVELIFGAWCVLAFAVALPVLVCYFYFVLALVLPLAMYTWVQRELLFKVALHPLRTVKDRKSYKANIKALINTRSTDKWELVDSPASVAAVERDASRVLLVWKRLVLLFVLAAAVLSIKLWPFYQGQTYIDVLTSAASQLGVSLEFWELGWWAGFGWPDELPLPDQLVLSVSLVALGAEQILKLLLAVFGPNLVYIAASALKVDSRSLWGRWRNHNRTAGPEQPEQIEELGPKLQQQVRQRAKQVKRKKVII